MVQVSELEILGNMLVTHSLTVSEAESLRWAIRSLTMPRIQQAGYDIATCGAISYFMDMVYSRAGRMTATLFERVRCAIQHGGISDPELLVQRWREAEYVKENLRESARQR